MLGRPSSFSLSSSRGHARLTQKKRKILPPAEPQQHHQKLQIFLSNIKLWNCVLFSDMRKNALLYFILDDIKYNFTTRSLLYDVIALSESSFFFLFFFSVRFSPLNWAPLCVYDSSWSKLETRLHPFRYSPYSYNIWDIFCTFANRAIDFFHFAICWRLPASFYCYQFSPPHI